MSAKLATKSKSKSSTSNLVAKIKLIADALKELSTDNARLLKENRELVANIKDLKALLRKHENTRTTVKQRLEKMVNQLPRK